MSDKNKIENKVILQHNKTSLILALIFLVVLIAIVIFLRQNITQQPQQQNASFECQADAECIKVQTTCCPCNMGGTEKCVTIKNASEYTPKNCPTGNRLICTAFYNCEIESCKCIEGKCVN